MSEKKETTYSDISNTIVDAVEILTERAVAQAQYDKTIVASIVEVTDSGKGKYKVKYQDGSFYATVDNTEKKYTIGTEVYVLIPGNDFSRPKKILGTVKEITSSWKILADSAERYEDIGTNVIEIQGNKEEWSLSSYSKEDNNKKDSQLILYSFDKEEESDLKINIEDFKYYLSQSDLFEVSAKFATDIEEGQIQDSFSQNNYQTIPNYGLKIKVANENEIAEYVLDVKNMEGFFYQLLNYTSQKTSFNANEIDLDSGYIQEIVFFKENFKEDENNLIKDIFIKDISIICKKEIPEEKFNTYSLNISAPRGTILHSTKNPTISLKGNIVLEGEINTPENTKFYWGKENIFIQQNNEKYNKYLGTGWEFIQEQSELELKYDATSTTATYKCVALYDGTNLFEKEIVVKVAENEQQDFTIKSSSGETFFNSEGTTTLTIEGIEKNKDYIYQWVKIDSLKNVIYLNDDVDQDFLIVNGSDISRTATYKCGIKEKDTDKYLGTASIELKNTFKIESENITLYNANQSFLYDIAGKSPCYESNTVKQILLPLSFDFYNDEGDKINIKKLNSVRWKIPANNSMLKGFLDAEKVSQDDNFITLESFSEDGVSFEIRDVYYSNYKNNNITLEINYKGQWYFASTNFTFLKQGESGTNGTNYYGTIDIAFDLTEEEKNKYYYPTLEFFKDEDSDVFLNGKGLNSLESSFKGNLYTNGESIVDGVDFKWEILKNAGTNDSDRKSFFSLDTNNTKAIKIISNLLTEKPTSNILRLNITYEEKKYYAEIPIVTIKNLVDKSKVNHNFYIKKNTGFNKVMYAADGTCPQYTNIPFEYNLNEGYTLKIEENLGSVNFVLPTKNKEGEFEYQTTKIFEIIPPAYYNGATNDNGIYFTIIENETNESIAEIYFPIYLYLNRFGYSALNIWDGNSISINEEDKNEYILSPQIGAGKKDSNNRFTGLLMGTMISKGLENEDTENTGLLGFHEGNRTIFLDANTGKAEFGSDNKGKIILNPIEDAVIKSGNYIKKGTEITNSSGDKEESSGDGMEINLTKPYIKWGNENFSVDSNGILTCNEGTISGKITSSEGKIGGWNLSSQNLYGTLGFFKENITTERVSVPVTVEVEKEEKVEKISCICSYTTDDYQAGSEYFLKEEEFDPNIFTKNLDENGNPIKIIEVEKIIEKEEKTVEQEKIISSPILSSENNYISLQSIFNQQRKKSLKKEIFSIGVTEQEEELYFYKGEELDLLNGELFFEKDNYYWLSKKEIELLQDNNKFSDFEIQKENGESLKQNGFNFQKGKSFLYSNGEIQGTNFFINTQSSIKEPLLEMTRDSQNFMKIYHRSENSKYGIGFGISTEETGYIYKGVFSIGLNSVDPYEDLVRTLGTEELRWRETYTYDLNTFRNTFIGSSLRMKDPEYGTTSDTSKKKWKSVLQLQTSPGTIGEKSYYGSDLLIGAGARIILGSGESYTSIYNTYFKNNKEDSLEGLFLTSDSEIRFYINCNTTSNNRYLRLYNYAGSEDLPAGPLLRADKDKEAYLGSAGYRWRKIYCQDIDAEGNIKTTSGNIKTTSGNITTTSGDITTTSGDIKAGTFSLKTHTHDVDYVKNEDLNSKVKNYIEYYVKSNCLQNI